METLLKSASYAANVILFVLLSIVFLPALLVVTSFQATWSKMLGELFDY